jgi:hypothetical protein
MSKLKNIPHSSPPYATGKGDDFCGVGLKEDVKKITVLKFDKIQSLFVYNFLNFVYSHYFMYTKVFGKKNFG